MKFSLTLSILVALFFVGCGYKPSSKFARNVVGEKISTSITISSSDPENSVIIKDAIDSAIISTFHASLVDKRNSTSHLSISTSTPSYSAIEYDTNGFVIGYRMSITLHIKHIKDGVSKSYTAKGTFDFGVDANAIVTDQERFNAIQNSAKKALNSFISQLSASGARDIN